MSYTELGGQFKFFVTVPDKGEYGDNSYNVSLPHQCGSWEIFDEDYGTKSADKEEAIAYVRLFIEEATVALRVLEHKK
jgi:hypothetical protein